MCGEGYADAKQASFFRGARTASSLPSPRKTSNERSKYKKNAKRRPHRTIRGTARVVASTPALARCHRSFTKRTQSALERQESWSSTSAAAARSTAVKRAFDLRPTRIEKGGEASPSAWGRRGERLPRSGGLSRRRVDGATPLQVGKAAAVAG